MEIAKLILEYIKALVWPLTAACLALFFRFEIKKALARLRKAALPGGVSFDLQEEVQEVKLLSEKVESTVPSADRKRTPGIPLTEANARMISLGLTPTSSGLDMTYYRNLAGNDPVLALAGVRIELEVLLRNLGKGFKLQTLAQNSPNRLLLQLRDAGAVTPDQMQLAQKIFRVCNRAIHGHSVTKEEAEDVIDATDVLLRDYLAWLSWGFDDNWKPARH